MHPRASERVVVMTGATSGLGAHALREMVTHPGTRAIIGAREAGPDDVAVLPLDLASLASVRAFAAEVEQRLGPARIDALVLNAAAQYRNVTRTVDGFEATFAVNHLAHYLLARLLFSRMAEGGRLVLTTSDMHDRKVLPWFVKPMAPTVMEPRLLANPGEPKLGLAVRAYAASKLCNILTVRAFAVLDDVRARNIEMIAYNPGLTLGTKLGRSPSDRQRPPNETSAFVRALLGLASRLNQVFYPGTPERAGEALAQLAFGTVTPPAGRVYASLVRGEITFPDPSILARSDEARDRLWRESAEMVGLTEVGLGPVSKEVTL